VVIVISKVIKKMEMGWSEENKLKAMDNPSNVEWEMAEPINAFFRAMINGEMSPQTKLKKTVAISAYIKKSKE
jgi:hypothetical protein